MFFIPQRSTRPNVNASPLKNIAELKNVQFVMKAGLIYKQ
ncbi:Xaa-Pro dipeptidase family enzyme [Pseudoalteromonas sp. JB197]|nr:Xaa-Pro dipeptidase family enzyme [Pseudoalteromonas sp. JB197]